jgi:hypothetical protein
MESNNIEMPAPAERGIDMSKRKFREVCSEYA